MYKADMSITQECMVLEQGEDGVFIYSDSFTTMCGAGDTPEEAIGDYLNGIGMFDRLELSYKCVPTVEGVWLWSGAREVPENWTKYKEA